MPFVIEHRHDGELEDSLAQLGNAPVPVLKFVPVRVLHNAQYTPMLGTEFQLFFQQGWAGERTALDGVFDLAGDGEAEIR